METVQKVILGINREKKDCLLRLKKRCIVQETFLLTVKMSSKNHKYELFWLAPKASIGVLMVGLLTKTRE